jgi:S-DNA-T family DNA segregation ATPase FtsK/SpoIIIE
MTRLVDVTVCDECGFDYASEDETTIPERLRKLGGRFGVPLSKFLPGEDGDALLRAHPVEGAWSALEYACHVRDVLLVQRDRVAQVLAEETPTFEPMRRNERAVELVYNEQDPTVVASEVAGAADALAIAFADLTTDQWARTGVYGYPEPAERSLVWIGQHTVHELSHHLLDVGRTLRAARGR